MYKRILRRCMVVIIGVMLVLSAAACGSESEEDIDLDATVQAQVLATVEALAKTEDQSDQPARPSVVLIPVGQAAPVSEHRAASESSPEETVKTPSPSADSAQQSKYLPLAIGNE